jgi:hypothetical protein
VTSVLAHRTVRGMVPLLRVACPQRPPRHIAQSPDRNAALTILCPQKRPTVRALIRPHIALITQKNARSPFFSGTTRLLLPVWREVVVVALPTHRAKFIDPLNAPRTTPKNMGNDAIRPMVTESAPHLCCAPPIDAPHALEPLLHGRSPNAPLIASPRASAPPLPSNRSRNPESASRQV